MTTLPKYKRFLKSISRYYRFVIACIYVLGYLVFGEVHPFSSFPMYDSFPNWSYAFYFSDEHDSLIPSSEFNFSPSDINHMFYAICEKDKIDYGNGVESMDELHAIGKELTCMVVQPNSKYHYSSIRLHRIYFRYEDDEIVQNDVVIYEKHF